jgi:hypothetical protein
MKLGLALCAKDNHSAVTRPFSLRPLDSEADRINVFFKAPSEIVFAC